MGSVGDAFDNAMAGGSFASLECELLDLDVANTHLVVEHEYPKARIQDKERLKPILQGSIAFVRHSVS